MLPGPTHPFCCKHCIKDNRGWSTHCASLHGRPNRAYPLWKQSGMVIVLMMPERCPVLRFPQDCPRPPPPPPPLPARRFQLWKLIGDYCLIRCCHPTVSKWISCSKYKTFLKLNNTRKHALKVIKIEIIFKRWSKILQTRQKFTVDHFNILSQKWSYKVS